MYKKNKIDLHATFMHPVIKELIPTKIYFPRHHSSFISNTLLVIILIKSVVVNKSTLEENF